MVVLAIALMIVGAIAFVAYPLFATARELDDSLAERTDPALESLVVQRDATYAAIKDLEFDHAMSKLSDADYRTLRSKYEAKAAATLQELDGLAETRWRRVRVPVNDESIERQVQQLRGARRVRCAKCGTLAGPSDRFCARCGAPVHQYVGLEEAA
ncbi:MAG: zinc ribbon domain-containing protein [Chloroflexi bacterium]|nr:zinc ribbon domain-containing protein [Chloroflexota bacterium]